MTDARVTDRSLALCLSGGGLRATLFHLGTIRALRACRIDGRSAIGRVAEVYSVSGGSILAAHMLLHWDRYTGDAAAFAEVEQEILTFVQRNLRDRVLRRALLTALPLFLWRTLTRRPVSGRTFWLGREYRALLGKATIADSLRPAGEGPLLHILTTSFRTGELCSFSANRFEVERTGGDVIAAPCGHIPLAFAVAASSAFPPMFPPLVVTDDLLANPFSEAFLNPILLSDGGVYDNLGIEKFRRNMSLRQRQQPPAPGPDTLIISNAGASFRASATKSYSGPLSRNVRASDILMHRVGDNAEETINAMTDIDDIVVRLSTSVDDGTLDVTVQQRLRMVRTDLDRFGPELARLLIDHGERVTAHALAAKGWTIATSPPAAPAPVAAVAASGAPAPPVAAAGAAKAGAKDLDALHRLACKAANRSFWSLAFDFRDWRPLLALWLLALSLAGGGIYLASSYLAAKNATRELNARNARDLAGVSDALRKDNIAGAKAIVFAALTDAQTRQDDPQTPASPAAAVPAAPPTVAATGRSSPHPQRVYIQFAGTFTREQIVALNGALRAAGWNMQSSSGERTSSAQNVNEVRFAGDNALAARDLADALNAMGIVRQKVGTRSNPTIGGNLEIWISN